MIQFNLLPDVKKEYVKARRTKRLIMVISFVASTVSVVIVFLMFGVVQLEKKNITDLTKDIKGVSTEITSTENLNEILTVQNQLSLLPGLHEQKPLTSRLFKFVTFVSPVDVKVSTLNVDIVNTQIVFSGSADSIATINRFVDNLKIVRYYTAEDKDTLIAPFTGVTTGLSGDNESASFKITATFDPAIFDNTQEVEMRISNQTSENVETAPTIEAQDGAQTGEGQ